jgi:predicted kinase
LLIVLAGLPGVGKTSIARQLSRDLPAFWLRIDTIEQSLRNQGVDVWAHGYEVGYALAADNLTAGRNVVADCVNPLKITRDAWAAVAKMTGTDFIDIEIICSDPAEHRRRIETRMPDIEGHKLPDWASVTAHDYEPWNRSRLVLDTAGRNASDIVRDLINRLP